MINHEMMIGQVIEIQGRQLFVDLIMFEMLNYDMILWIDFLERNRAEIDCRCRKV